MEEEYITIPKCLEKIANLMCDNYCKFPDEYKENEDALWKEKCENCPLNYIT